MAIRVPATILILIFYRWGCPLPSWQILSIQDSRFSYRHYDYGLADLTDYFILHDEALNP